MLHGYRGYGKIILWKQDNPYFYQGELYSVIVVN